jgi:hypothetical protein
MNQAENINIFNSIIFRLKMTFTVLIRFYSNNSFSFFMVLKCLRDFIPHIKHCHQQKIFFNHKTFLDGLEIVHRVLIETKFNLKNKHCLSRTILKWIYWLCLDAYLCLAFSEEVQVMMISPIVLIINIQLPFLLYLRSLLQTSTSAIIRFFI